MLHNIVCYYHKPFTPWTPRLKPLQEVVPYPVSSLVNNYNLSPDGCFNYCASQHVGGSNYCWSNEQRHRASISGVRTMQDDVPTKQNACKNHVWTEPLFTSPSVLTGLSVYTRRVVNTLSFCQFALRIKQPPRVLLDLSAIAAATLATTRPYTANTDVYFHRKTLIHSQLMWTSTNKEHRLFLFKGRCTARSTANVVAN